MTNEETIRWLIDSPFYHKEHEPFNKAIKALEQPEIIRCWECKWHEGTNFCGNFNVIGFYPNDYCSLAERKKENDVV